MGADPEKPDIFIHLDYMQDATHNQRLSDEALETLVEAFANSPYESPTESVGINVHIDQGPDSTLDFGEETEWGALSRAGSAPLITQGFENGPAGWYPERSQLVERSTDEAHAGNSSVKIASFDRAMDAKYLPKVTPAGTYDLTIWVFLPSSYSGTELHLTIADDTNDDSTAVSMSTRDAWQEVVITGFTSTGVEMEIGFVEDGTLPESGDFIYMDDVVLDPGPVAFDSVLGAFVNNDPEDDYIWDEFDDIKALRFLPTGRQHVFHYAIAAYAYGVADFDSSGIARIGESDFIVSLGQFYLGVGSVEDQAGTFMHELGHNLGLLHGGDVSRNYKPNYLSIMNYLFQLSGIIHYDAGLDDYVDGRFDYSGQALDSLDEERLAEEDGLGSSAALFGTAYYCSSVKKTIARDASEWIDWNCNNLDGEDPFAADISNDSCCQVLSGWNDWAYGAIEFRGGAIGSPGAGKQLEHRRPLARSILNREKLIEHKEIGFEEARRKGLLSRRSYPALEPDKR